MFVNYVTWTKAQLTGQHTAGGAAPGDAPLNTPKGTESVWIVPGTIED